MFNELKTIIADLYTGYSKSICVTDIVHYNEVISNYFQYFSENAFKQTTYVLNNLVESIDLIKPITPTTIQLLQIFAWILVYFMSITSSVVLIQHLAIYWLKRNKRSESNGNNTSVIGKLPLISILIPIRNEEPSILKRIISTIGLQEYPKNLIEVIVISDDSIENFKEIQGSCIKQSSELGLDIQVIGRESPQGHKAGALNYALKTSKGEYIAVFDVDSVLQPQFLRKAASFLISNSKYDTVVGQWNPINKNSPVAKAQGSGMEFLTEVFYTRKSTLDLPIIILGSGSVYRKSFLEEMGGWNEKILAEDIELWVRSVLKGKKIAYLDDLRIGVEVPETYAAFKRQHSRWMYGTAQVLKRYFVDILRADIPALWKIDIFTYLWHYEVLLTNVFLMGLSLVSIFLGLDLVIVSQYPSLWLLALTAFYTYTYLDYFHGIGKNLKDCIFDLGTSTVIVSTLLPTITLKIAKSLIGLRETWQVTPKGSRARSLTKKPVQEWAFGGLGILLGLYALEIGLFATSSFLIMMSIPYIYVAIRTKDGLW